MYEKLNKYDCTLKSLNSLKNKISSLKTIITKKSCFLGLDGFIDSLYNVIQSRESLKKWNRMDNMKEFGKLVMCASAIDGSTRKPGYIHMKTC